MPGTVHCDGASLTLEDVVRVARDQVPVELADEARAEVEASRAHVDDLVAADETVYGITTGLGELKNVRIDTEDSRRLQENLLASHACGVGEPLAREVVRAMMLLRANALAKGHSGVRPVVIERLIEALNTDLVPVVPRKGSVGSSGDLVPLAHMARPLTGEGRVLTPDGEEAEAEQALPEHGLEPLRLEAKEGLALINGTQLQAAIAALLVHDGRRALATACVTGAMSVEGLRASRWPFDERLARVRPHAGAKRVATSLDRLLEDSGIMLSHKDCDKVQDPYSFRCMPQVHGAVLDAVDHLADVVEVELNSANDNPLVFPEDELVISGGNFHGEPLGQPLAYVTSCLAKLATASERRTTQLLQGEDVELPPFLTTGGGVNSGLMIPQYVSASLVNENQALVHPVVADTVPTSGNQEDVNAMSATQALHARRVLANLETVLAIEAITAAQAIDFHSPIQPGVGVQAAHDRVREEVDTLDGDRELSSDIQALRSVVASGDLLAVAAQAAGGLPIAEGGR